MGETSTHHPSFAAPRVSPSSARAEGFAVSTAGQPSPSVHATHAPPPNHRPSCRLAAPVKGVAAGKENALGSSINNRLPREQELPSFFVNTFSMSYFNIKHFCENLVRKNIRQIAVLVIAFLLLCSGKANAQQYTADFSSAPTFTEKLWDIWYVTAEVTLGGDVYQIKHTGNDSWHYGTSGGKNNSASINHAPYGTQFVTIQRKDTQPFKFYGVWLKYISNTGYPAPYLKVSYNGSSLSPETYGSSQTIELAKDVTVTSVTLNFSGLNGLNLDNLIVGPASVAPNITLSPASLSSGTVGSNYNATITASGGTAPYIYTRTAGTLPTGLSLSSSGTLTGTPTASGTFNFTVTASDNVAYTGSKAYSLTIAPQPTTTVSSIARANPSPTNATTVNYTVTFAAAVTGVDASDFTLITTGPAFGTIGSVSGSGTTYTVSVNNVSGNGTLRLDFTGTTGVTPNVNATYTSGEVYTIDNTAPASPVVVAPVNSSLSNNNKPTYSGTAEPNSSIVIEVSGTVVGTVTADAAGNWSLLQPFALSDGDWNVKAWAKDVLGNTSSQSNINYFKIDATTPAAPTVSAVANGTVTNNNNPTFSGKAEAFTTVTLYIDGVSRGTAIVDGSDNWVVTPSVSYTEGSHTVYATATDAAGNISPASNTNTFVYDATRPLVTSIIRHNPTTATTSADILTFRVTFSEKVNGVDANDFSVSGTTASVTNVTAVATEGKAYDIAISGGNLPGYNGTVSLSLASGQDIADVAGNFLINTAPTGSIETYTLSNAGPNTILVSKPAELSNSTTATFGLSSDQANVTYEFSLNGSAYIGTSNPLVLHNLAEGQHTVLVRAKDLYNNVDATPAEHTWTVDVTKPTVVSIIRQNPTTATTNASSVTFRVTFSEDVTGVTHEDFNVAETGTIVSSLQSATAVAPGSSVYDVVVNINSGTGTAKLNLRSVNTGVTDLAGNVIVDGGFTGGEAYTLDLTAPVISSVTLPAANKTYTAGENLDFTVYFSEDVTVTGTPSIAITIGNTTRSATYVAGSSTATALLFRYQVQAGEVDTDGIAFETQKTIALNGGTLQDLAGNNATLTFTTNFTTPVKVDAEVPQVASVSVPASGIYKTDDILNFTVNFSENIIVTGDATTLKLQVGTTNPDRFATFANKSANSITYQYKVLTGDIDSDGISIEGLVLNGATIQDAAGNNADITLQNVGNTAGVNIDAVAPTITSVALPADKVYKAGDNLDFVFTFSESMAVNGATSTLALTIGENARTASHLSTVSNKITYRYTVQAGETDADGIGVGTIALNTATFRDWAGNNADLTFTPGSTAGILVDGVAPTLVSVTQPADGTYKVGDKLQTVFTYSEPVVVTGDQIEYRIRIGTANIRMLLESGSGTNSLVFSYTVRSGDLDTDGIQVNTSLTIGSATVADHAGNLYVSALFSVPSTAGILVDGVAPAVASVAYPADGAYKAGQNLDFTVTFTEAVAVTGTPSLALTIGSVAKEASYISGSGSNGLVFRYTVADGDLDTDGNILTGPAIALNGGTITDLPGNQATLTLNNVASGVNVKVDAVVPVAPVIAAVNTDTGLSNMDRITSDQTLILSGTAEPNSIVSLYLGGTLLGTVNADATGNWTYDHSAVVLPEGEHVFTAAATDAAQNTSAMGADFRVTIDITKPVAPVIAAISEDRGTSNTDGITNDATLILSGTAEPNVRVTLSLGGNALASPVMADNNGNWIYDYTATTLMAGTHSFTANATDAAGNVSEASSAFAVMLDQTAPTVTVTADRSLSTNLPFTATFTFSEVVAGFEIGDITLANASAEDLQTADNITYTATIRPIADGNVTVQLTAGVVTDVAGNSNSASNIFSILFDGARPEIALSSTAPDSVNAAFQVKVTFNEDVTGFEAGDVTVTNGSVSSLIAVNAREYTVTVMPAADGVVTVSILENVALDASGNPNLATTASLSRIYDITRPTVALQSAAVAGDSVKAPFAVTFRFSEPVEGFTLADISVVKGTAGTLAQVGTTQTEFTATITPAVDGAVNVSVAENRIVDGAGNGNTASNTISRMFDGTAPTVVLSSAAVAGDSVRAPFMVTFQFSEPVGGFELADITVTNGSAGALTQVGTNQTEYTATITPTADGLVSVSVGANTVIDRADNPNTASNTISRMFDGTAPTVVLSSAAVAGDSVRAPFMVTFQFSEPV
ncbi:Ig-like domain-containing protein, partial [Rufibacter roseus]